MPSTVRSVTVRLEADVAKYIADMEAAAAATRAAFSGANGGGLGGGNASGIRDTERAVQSLTDRTRTLSTTTRDTRRELDQFRASNAAARAEVDRLASSLRGVDINSLGAGTRRLGSELDRTSGRMRILIDSAVALGPALIPIGAAAAGALPGLAAGLGAAAAGAGVMALAFHGVGDALTAVNKAQLDPTVKNLQAADAALAKLGPSGAAFVEYIDSLGPKLTKLQQVARNGFLPGLQDGIGDLVGQLPAVSELVGRISTELGRLSSSAGKSLTGDSDWRAFFAYLKSDAAPTLDAFGRSIGNFAAGLASMMTNLAPLSRGLADDILSASRSFRSWAANSSNFQSFISYVQKVGPEVGQFFSALGSAVAGVVHAMQPWGTAVLPILTSVADVFGVIAKSPIGPVLFSAAAGMLAFNRAMAIGSSQAITRARTGLTGLTASLRSIPSVARYSASAYGAALTNMGNLTATQTRRISTANRLMQRTLNSSAVRTGALIGGTLLAGSALSTTSKTKGTLEGAGAGALIGLSTGTGLVGAGVGAAIGGLAGFVSSLHNASAASDQAAADWSSLGATLSASGKVTSQTLGDIASQFSQSGILSLGQKYGLTADQIVGAVSGSKANYQNTLGQLQTGIVNKDYAGDKVQDLAYNGGGVANNSDAYKKFKAAVDGARSSLALQTAAQKAANDAASSGAGALANATAEVKAYMDAQNKLHDATLSNLDAQFAFGQAFNDLKKQAESGEKGLNRFTKAGQDNEAAMSKFASDYNQQGAGIKNSVKQYDRAKGAIADFGHQMGLTRQQIKNFQDLLDKPKKLSVNDVEAQQRIKAVQRLMTAYGLTKAEATALLKDSASGKIHTVQQLVDRYGLTKKQATALLQDLASGKLHDILGLLAGLHDKTVTVRLNNITENSVITHYRRTGSTGDSASQGAPNKTPHGNGADGTTVPKDNLPYGDRYLYMLAPGEEVISNRYGQADRFRADRAAGRIPGYADGGTVGASTGLDPQIRKELGIAAAVLVGGIVHAIGHATGSKVAGASTGMGPHWSASALGDQYANMTTRQIRALGKSIDDLDKKSLKKFGNALDHAIDIEKQRQQAAQQAIDAIKQDKADLSSTVQQGLTWDTFSDTGTSTWNTANASGSLADWRKQRHGEETNADQFAHDITTLRKRGATDAFINYIGSQQDPASFAHQLATESAAAFASDQRLFTNDQAALGAAGSAAAATYNDNQVAANKHLADINAHIQALQADVKATNAELAEIKKQAKRQHAESKKDRADNSSKVVKGVNGAAARGARNSR